MKKEKEPVCRPFAYVSPERVAQLDRMNQYCAGRIAKGCKGRCPECQICMAAFVAGEGGVK